MSKPRDDGWLVHYSRDGQQIISISLPPKYCPADWPVQHAIVARGDFEVTEDPPPPCDGDWVCRCSGAPAAAPALE
jgi:hypothetical protein